MPTFTSGRPRSVEVSSRATRYVQRSEEHTSDLQSRPHLVCRLLLEKKKTCPTFRNAFPEFNPLDQQAILWILYRETALAQIINNKNVFSTDPFFTYPEVITLEKIGL